MGDKTEKTEKVKAGATSRRAGSKTAEEPDTEIPATKPPATPKTSRKDRTVKDKDKDKSKTKEAAEGQQTLDQHLVATGKQGDGQLDETLKGFSETLKKLASQEFIESKLKDMVTEEILSNKLKELETQVKEQIKKEIEAVNDHVAKFKTEIKDKVDAVEKKVTTLRNKVSDMETTVDTLTEENKKIREENKKIREQLSNRELKLKVQEEEINSLEQYTRRNSIRIYGLNDTNKNETYAETAGKVIKLVKEKLLLDISPADIDIAHRLGAFTDDGDRPVICKFVSRVKKHAVVKARSKLAKSGTVIKEDLTRRNVKRLAETKECEAVETAWSDEGKIIALLKNGKKVVINWKTDLNKLSAE